MLSISLYAVDSLFQWRLALSSLFEDLQEVRGLSSPRTHSITRPAWMRSYAATGRINADAVTGRINTITAFAKYESTDRST